MEDELSVLLLVVVEFAPSFECRQPGNDSANSSSFE
jgi:hypothetical protein